MEKIEGKTSKDIQVPVGGNITLDGNLSIPKNARGVVVFAHGSGSSRFSPRNQFVAGALQQAGLATLLFDLLTADEEARDRMTGQFRFDIDLLGKRVVGAIDWLSGNPATQALNVGCFGASTGGAAALVAAAVRPRNVGAVVSRGGRPDLAGPYLERVQAPTLLIVGGLDTQVLKLNEMALSRLRSEKRLEVIAGATHLFEEPGTLERVAQFAGQWFTQYLG